MPVMTLEEAYSHLEVHPSSDEATVKSAYKKMALRTHPDKNPNDPDARYKFQKVSEAYKRITDPDSFKGEDDEGDFDMDMDDLNEMFFSLFEDMIPMMMGGFNPSRMSGGAASLFDILSAGGADMFDMSDEDSDDEYGEIPDGDLEDVMAMMMGGMMGGGYMGGRGGRGSIEEMMMEQMMGGRGGGMDDMAMMEQMMMGGMMGGGRAGRRAHGGWVEEEPSSAKKKKNRKKKKKPKAAAVAEKDEDTRWETASEDEGEGTKPPRGSASTVPKVSVSANSKAKGKVGRSGGFDMPGGIDADVPDMEAMLTAMMMAGGSSAGMDGLFEAPPSKPARAAKPPASAAKKRTSSKLSADDDGDDTYGDLYEIDDLVMVHNRYCVSPYCAMFCTKRYCLTCRDLARVRYVGPVEYADGVFIGVELIDKSGVGKNNGIAIEL